MKKRLTNKQIIALCDGVISKIKKAQENQYKTFLCDEVRIYTSGHYTNKYIHQCEIINYIPKFTIENAIKYADARIPMIDDVGWWDGMCKPISEFNYQDRIKFMFWIKEQYTFTFKKWLLKISNYINF